jgi:glutathione S-transferase
MPEYQLHYFPESGNSYKLALMLALCGQEFEPIWTDFGGGVTFTAEWRKTLNPMGEIPVLIADGEKLTQTAPILLDLAKKFGRFGGSTEAERFEILRWLFWDNQKLSSFMATYRYMRAFTPSPDAQVLKYLKRRLDDFLSIVENRLAEQPYIVGASPTIADLSMIAYLSFPPVESGYDFCETYPAVHAWLQRIGSLSGWQKPYDLLPGKRLHFYVP